MLSVVWQIRVLADSVWSSEACQMLPHQHLLYHLKRVILPTMTVIPPERATLTEAPSMGSTGSRLLRPASAAFWELCLCAATLSTHVCTSPNLCVQLNKKKKEETKRKNVAFLCSCVPTCQSVFAYGRFWVADRITVIKRGRWVNRNLGTQKRSDSTSHLQMTAGL